MMSLRVPRPPSSRIESLGLMSNFQRSSLVLSALKLYTQPSPPPKITCTTPPISATVGLDHCPCKMFLPGALSVQRISPVFLSIARKLGASGAGMVMWASSTPLLVFTYKMSPQLVTEQLH